MGRGVKIPCAGVSKYHDIPWIGGLIYYGLGLNSMGRKFNIPWVGGQYTIGRV